MKIVISTQYMENYGWCDGNVGVNARWKYKGGSTYVVPVTLAQALDVKSVMDSVRHLVEHDSDSCREYILDWELVDDCETPWEEWEEPTFFNLVDGVWSACIHRVASRDGQHYTETWVCGPGHFERENYVNSYVA